MKTFTIRKYLCVLGIILISISRNFAQVPPNLLGQNEDGIKTRMFDLHVIFDGKDYTKTGKPYLKFHSDYNLESKQNSNGDSMVVGFFKLEIENHCTQCIYLFADNINLEKIVTSMDADVNFKRKEEVFGWESVRANFDVIIKKDNEGKGFTFTYIWLPTLRKTQ